MLDWIIKTTGRVQNFAYDNRVVPPEVKSYAQIHRIADKHGRHVISIAEAAEAAGHTTTAAELYWAASEHYREAQHTIFEDDNAEKIYLHGMLLKCFDKVMQHANHPIETGRDPLRGQLHSRRAAHAARPAQGADRGVLPGHGHDQGSFHRRPAPPVRGARHETACIWTHPARVPATSARSVSPWTITSALGLRPSTF